MGYIARVQPGEIRAFARFLRTDALIEPLYNYLAFRGALLVALEYGVTTQQLSKVAS